jgi:hypothetical protein
VGLPLVPKDHSALGFLILNIDVFKPPWPSSAYGEKHFAVLLDIEFHEFALMFWGVHEW